MQDAAKGGHELRVGDWCWAGGVHDAGTGGVLEAELADYDALHDSTLFEATGLGQLP